MVKVKLKEILEDKEKTIYWLAKQTGISNHALAKLAKNETDRITFDTITKICKTLDVEIKDLLILE